MDTPVFEFQRGNQRKKQIIAMHLTETSIMTIWLDRFECTTQNTNKRTVIHLN